MKNYTIFLLVLIAGFLSFNLSAQNTYHYDITGTWIPSDPFVTTGNGNSAVTSLSTPDTVYIDSGATFSITGNTNLSSNSVIIVNGTLSGSGSVTLTNDGTIYVTSIGVIDLGGTVDFVNNGLLILEGTFNSTGNVSVGNSGAIVGTGTFNFGGNTSNNFSNTGVINGCNGDDCFANPLNLGDMIPGIPGIELDSLIFWDGTNYVLLDGATPVVPDCSHILLLNSDLGLVGEDLVVGFIITSTNIMTIDATSSLKLCNGIINDTTITVESGGSLVQVSESDPNLGKGEYIIKQAGGQSGTDTAWNMWSSPIDSATILNDNSGAANEVFSGSNACGIYVIDGSDQSWKYDFDPTLNYTCVGNSPVSFNTFTTNDGVADGVMDIARGYWVAYFTGAPSTRTFTGEINNGEIASPIYFGAPIQFSISDVNFVGNPYPSAISAQSFIADNTSINGVLYFYDDTSDTWVTISSSGSNVTSATDNIGVAQGFYVIATSTDSVYFKNSQRSITNDQFFKTDNNSNNHNVWLSFISPSGAKENVLIAYSNQSTDNYDMGVDAQYMANDPSLKFVSTIRNDEFAIQSVASIGYGETKAVALLVVTSENGDYVFTEPKRENIPTGMNVYLKDNETNKLYDLTKGDYSVHLEGNQEYANRFELVFENVMVSNDNHGTITGSDNVATGVEDVDNSTWNLSTSDNSFTLSNSNEITGDVQVVSVTGTVVWSKNNVNANSVQIDMNGVSAGIYFVQVINNNERVYSNKIVK